MSLSKWSRTGITIDTMKDFCIIFNCTLKNVQLSEGSMKLVKLSDIIPMTMDWQETIWRYVGLLKRIDSGTNEFTDSAWWKHEVHNQTKDIQKRLKRFRDLYSSIKRDGFSYFQKNHIKLLDVRDMERYKPERGGRISYKYYRINGMKRVLICNYLGMESIPVKSYGVSK